MPEGKRNCKCKSKHRFELKSKTSPVWLVLILAILPKCPFCILSISSAIAMCSGTRIYQHSPIWSSYISIVLACLTIAFVLWNFKGTKTWLATLLAAGGCYLIIESELVTGMLDQYYIGLVLLFAGIWLNGSMMYFIRRIRDRSLMFVTKKVNS